MEVQSARPRLRNPIACENCKAKKSRCNPSDVEGKCQKCLKSGQRCVPSERHPRPRKPRISKTSGRVAELEKKLDGLLNSVEGKKTPSHAEKECLDEVPEASGPGTETGTTVLIDIHSTMFPGGTIPEQNSSDDELEFDEPSSPWANSATPNSSIRESNTSQSTASSFPDSSECEKLLSHFREMVSYFPFIVMAQDVDLKSLLQEKHFLSLAMMAAASFGNAKFQTVLDTQFRQALSTKVIMGGQKSLEIIQGLLIYTAWYPYHLKPRNAQTFQFLQILISMCNDLGIDQPAKASEDAELRRAYLGCYYLSTSFSITFKKPNNIKYTEYTKYCCELFATNPELPTDTLLPWLVDLCHSTVLFTKTPLTADIPLDGFKASLQTIGAGISRTKEPATLALSFANVYQTSILGPGGINPKVSQDIPLEIRQQNLKPCVESCINFLDTVLSLSIKSFLSFTIIQWSQIVCSIATLTWLSFPIANFPTWDGTLARKEGRLGIYLESLCYRMKVLGSKVGGKSKIGGEKNHFQMMGVVLEFVKSSYDQRIEQLASIDLNTPLSNLDGSSDATTRSRTDAAFPKGPTKCPMLNGSMRSLATDSSTGWSSMSEPFNGINDFDSTSISHQDFDFDLGEWGSSLDDFSMWDATTEMDWDLSNQGVPHGT